MNPETTDTATLLNKALSGLVSGFAGMQSSSLHAEPFLQELTLTFALRDGFRQKLEHLDETVSRNPAFEQLREVLFDLLMVRYLSTDSKMMNPDYLDSPEWLKIEDETLDRGTEMLNLLLYLNDCRDSEVTPSLNDFLEEFLLVNEEEFAEEQLVYEDIIENRELAGENAETIVQWGGKLNSDSQVQDFFIPLFAYFSQVPAPELQSQLTKYHPNPAYQFALFQCLNSFAA